MVEVLASTKPLAAKDGSPSKVRYETAAGVADRVHDAASELLGRHPLYAGLELTETEGVGRAGMGPTAGDRRERR